jgi:hypothetical protein
MVHLFLSRSRWCLLFLLAVYLQFRFELKLKDGLAHFVTVGCKHVYQSLHNI